MNSKNTHEVSEKFFRSLERGDVQSALSALSDDIEFEMPRNEWSAVLPFLGLHCGVKEVGRAFDVRAETAEVLRYELRDLRAAGDTAFAVVRTRSRHRDAGQEFQVEAVHQVVVGADNKIKSWREFFGPDSGLSPFAGYLNRQLVEAVRAGDRERTAQLLHRGARVNHHDPDSHLTPLMIAAGMTDPELVRILLEAGADVFTGDSAAGLTPLHKACQGGSLEIVELLVEAGAFVDAVAPTTGHTPLMDALWFKYPEITKYLLDRGAGLNLSTHYGFSLKEHFGYELRVNAIGKDRLLLAERYLKERDRSDQERAAGHRLMAAVTRGDVEAVRALLEEGVPVDERYPIVNGFNDGCTPLIVAARDGHFEIVRLLLEAGADVNAYEPTFGGFPLHKAVYNGHCEMTRLIANWPGVNIDFIGFTNGYTALHDALWHGYEECARILVEAGARLDLRGHDGKTPEQIAAEVFGPDHEIVRLVRPRQRSVQGVR